MESDGRTTLSRALRHPVHSARALRWRLGLSAQLVRRRLAQQPLLDRHLPWPLWLRLCGWNAEAVVGAIGRMSDPGLCFIQVGSNDGLANDPLHATVVAEHWRGVLVEPIPWVYERLVENYRGVEGLRFENAAVSDAEGTLPMFYVEARPDDPTFVDQLFSFDEAVLRTHASMVDDFETRLRRTDVRTVTLAGLVAAHGLDHVDVLHVDAEGHDAAIVAQIDFDAPWAPRFVVFEAKHLSPERLRATARMLRRAGYRLFPIWHDAFAYRDHPRRSARRARAGCGDRAPA